MKVVVEMAVVLEAFILGIGLITYRIKKLINYLHSGEGNKRKSELQSSYERDVIFI